MAGGGALIAWAGIDWAGVDWAGVSWGGMEVASASGLWAGWAGIRDG